MKNEEKYLGPPPSILRSVFSFVTIMTLIFFMAFCVRRCEKKKEVTEEPSYRIDKKGPVFCEVRVNVGDHNEAWIIVLEK